MNDTKDGLKDKNIAGGETNMTVDDFGKNLYLKKNVTGMGQMYGDRDLLAKDKKSKNFDLTSSKNQEKSMYHDNLPLINSSPEWVENYRAQERERYRNPTKPWLYNLSDGQKVIVAPVAKKLTTVGAKPREHFL